jgi:hypothetical protein
MHGEKGDLIVLYGWDTNNFRPRPVLAYRNIRTRRKLKDDDDDSDENDDGDDDDDAAAGAGIANKETRMRKVVEPLDSEQVRDCNRRQQQQWQLRCLATQEETPSADQQQRLKQTSCTGAPPSGGGGGGGGGGSSSSSSSCIDCRFSSASTWPGARVPDSAADQVKGKGRCTNMGGGICSSDCGEGEAEGSYEEDNMDTRMEQSGEVVDSVTMKLGAIKTALETAIAIIRVRGVISDVR